MYDSELHALWEDKDVFDTQVLLGDSHVLSGCSPLNNAVGIVAKTRNVNSPYLLLLSFFVRRIFSYHSTSLRCQIWKMSRRRCFPFRPPFFKDMGKRSHIFLFWWGAQISKPNSVSIPPQKNDGWKRKHACNIFFSFPKNASKSWHCPTFLKGKFWGFFLLPFFPFSWML